MSIPIWADEQLSCDLSTLRAQGEGQHLEYKEEFPSNTSDLAKEIAAFATTNNGTILIGVADNGDLVGLKDGNDQKKRDELLRRLEGICRGTVKPSITPFAKFAVENGSVVLVINVPHGKQPIYYSNNKPYIRHLTESRAAEPHEVLEIFEDYFSSSVAKEDSGASEKSEFYSFLMRIITDTTISAEETDDRQVNPWLDQWRTDFEYSAEEIRDLAVRDIAIDESLSEDLNKLASSLDSVVNFRLALGNSGEFKKLVGQAKDILFKFKSQHIDGIELSDESIKQIKDMIVAAYRKLISLENRSNEMVNSGNIEELQSEASELGLQLLRASQYGISLFEKDARDQLTSIGRKLHLIETMRLYFDGGKSLQAVTDRVSEGKNALESWVETQELSQ